MVVTISPKTPKILAMEPKFQVERTTLRGTFGWPLWVTTCDVKALREKGYFFLKNGYISFIFWRPPDMKNQEDQYIQLLHCNNYSQKIRHQVFKKVTSYWQQNPTTCNIVWIIPYICHFFTRAKFLENKIYTEKRQFFALNL